MPRPVLLYDGGCRFCRFTARSLARLDRWERLALLPFADDASAGLLANLPEGERLASWHLVLGSGGIRSGEAAVADLLSLLGFDRLARGAARHEALVERLYRRVAAHRGLLGRFVPDGTPPHRFP